MVTASLACARSSMRAALTTFLSKVSKTFGVDVLVAPLRFPKTTLSYGLKILGQQTRGHIAASRFSFSIARNLT